jgi:hypothetical protein
MASYFDSFDSQNMFFFFDSCESGYFANALAKQGRVICVGSGFEGYYTYDDRFTRHGIFSYYALEATGLYNDAESICNYAMNNFMDWCAARGAPCDPQFSDSYSGNLIL